MSIVKRFSAWVSRAFAMDEGIDITDYIRHLERHFTITIKPADLQSVLTVGDMSELISCKLADSGRPAPIDVVWPAVQRITSEEMGVDNSEIHKEVRFAEDLCC